MKMHKKQNIPQSTFYFCVFLSLVTGTFNFLISMTMKFGCCHIFRLFLVRKSSFSPLSSEDAKLKTIRSVVLLVSRVLGFLGLSFCLSFGV